MKKFEIEMLPPIPEGGPINNNSSTVIINKNLVRLCLDVNEELAEKVKDHAYWERLMQKDMLLKIVEKFINEHPVEPRPQTARLQDRRGPKKKK